MTNISESEGTIDENGKFQKIRVQGTGSFAQIVRGFDIIKGKERWNAMDLKSLKREGGQLSFDAEIRTFQSRGTYEKEKYRMMEKDTGMRIAEYYQSAGPDAFTAKEKEIINRVRFYHEAVIAMGGNYPMTEEKFHLLSEHGVVILLYAKPFRLAERVRRRIGKRPTMDYSDVDGYVRQMLRKWTKWRDRVDLVINTTNCHPEQTALMIARYIDKHNIGFAARRGPGYPGREEHTEKRERNGRPSSHGRRSQ